MSQIVPDELEVAEEVEVEDPNALVQFGAATAARPGAATAARPSLESVHAVLTRTVWVRRTIEEALAARTVSAVVKDNGEIALRLDKSLPPGLIGYDAAPSAKGYQQFELWSKNNAKMCCPTFDLVAGPPEVGGTCPAARAAQTVCEPRIRRTMLTEAEAGAAMGADRQRVVKGQTILTEKMPVKRGGRVLVPFHEGDEPEPNQWRAPLCGSCYASSGNFRGMNVAVGGIVRYWWTRMLIEKDPALWVRTIVASMKQLEYPTEGQGDDAIRPVRVHSTGDFFDPRYAKAWIEVANEMYRWDPRIILWAPTRTWATPYWADSPKNGQSYWEKFLAPSSLISAQKGERLNFVVRCSGYHIGDEAPGKLHPTNAVGTTSIYAADNEGQGIDKRYDISCPVYNVDRDAKSCQWAYDPKTNELGCRACWRYNDLRVNFTTH